MQRNERTQFYELIINTAKFYNKTLDNVVIEMYWEDLENYEFNDIKTAILLHRKNTKRGKYMPYSADILEHLQSASKSKSLQKVNFTHFHCSIRECTNPGTLSRSTQPGNWICLKHYQDLDDNQDLKPPLRTAEIVNLATAVKRSSIE